MCMYNLLRHLMDAFLTKTNICCIETLATVSLTDKLADYMIKKATRLRKLKCHCKGPLQLKLDALQLESHNVNGMILESSLPKTSGRKMLSSSRNSSCYWRHCKPKEDWSETMQWFSWKINEEIWGSARRKWTADRSRCLSLRFVCLTCILKLQHWFNR